ncbi:IS66-like element accessory protein TnpA [Phreatobacter oligotrophus]|uniref:IS66-like element accessory protein TnpA n=1 Tax=Phreatobacter oligotrophus TaxID=1122261 RepID=UPI003CCBB9A6
MVGRRRWSADDRARILEETLAPGAVVSEVARRHGLTPQQLFTWRREARKAAETLPVFVPAVVERTGSEASDEPRRRGQRRWRPRSPAVELEAYGITVRIGERAAPAIIAAVIGALKAQR